MASQSRTSRPGARPRQWTETKDRPFFLSRKKVRKLVRIQIDDHHNSATAFGSRLCLIASLAVHSVGSPRGKRGVSSNAERLRALYNPSTRRDASPTRNGPPRGSDDLCSAEPFDITLGRED
jgi:hypothetical protein